MLPTISCFVMQALVKFCKEFVALCETCCLILQVLSSTAQWLASSQGFDKYGTPTAADLEDPKCSLYFCAAYLAVLSQHHGLRRSESFLIKAYHAGGSCRRLALHAVIDCLC